MRKLLKEGSVLFQLITYSLLIITLLFITISGIKLYRFVNGNKDINEHTRATLTYIQNQILNENDDNISVGTGPEGDMLILSNDDYNILIYPHEGSLCEEISTQTDYNPDRASRISACKELKIDIEKSTARIKIDGKSCTCTLRTERTE